ncbi:MAG: hypothetical protein BIFFINMI_01572 [Phycisphaerae bacterium]|nr:hypothetical protein [Phycisphaerae bacterium]
MQPPPRIPPIRPTHSRPTPAPVPPAPATIGPLSAEQIAELSQANQRRARLLRAAKLASLNGWVSGVFAACSLLATAVSPLFGGTVLDGLLITVGLAVVSWNEFRGRRMLLDLDLRGPRRLGCNQVLFMAVLIGYFAWQLVAALTGPSPYDSVINGYPEVADQVTAITDLLRHATILAYALLIGLSAIFQGLNAWYYFSRRRPMAEYLSQTPDWIVAVQRANAGQ